MRLRGALTALALAAVAAAPAAAEEVSGLPPLLDLGGPAPVKMPASGLADGTAVGVSEREFRISSYRRSVPAGVVRFNVTNFGEDAHNLVVVSPRGRVAAKSPEVRAGATHTLRTRLRRPGVYRLLCTKADHLERGMASRIRVGPARSSRR